MAGLVLLFLPMLIIKLIGAFVLFMLLIIAHTTLFFTVGVFLYFFKYIKLLLLWISVHLFCIYIYVVHDHILIYTEIYTLIDYWSKFGINN